MNREQAKKRLDEIESALTAKNMGPGVALGLAFLAGCEYQREQGSVKVHITDDALEASELACAVADAWVRARTQVAWVLPRACSDLLIALDRLEAATRGSVLRKALS